MSDAKRYVISGAGWVFEVGSMIPTEAQFVLSSDYDAIATLLPQWAVENQRKILYIECEQGHGRLVASNWLDHGCHHCVHQDLLKRLQEAQRDAERYAWLRNRLEVRDVACTRGEPRPAISTRIGCSYFDSPLPISTNPEYGAMKSNELDSAIDSAMSSQG